MDYQTRQLRSDRRMKSLLGVESLEPRALLAGLCGVPSTVLQPSVDSTPAPAAEIGPMRGGVDDGLQASMGPSREANFGGPQVVPPNLPPPVALPGDSADLNPDQAQPPSPLDPPSEVDITLPNVDSGAIDPNPWNKSEHEGEPGNGSSTDSLSPPCTADAEPESKSAATPPPCAASPARHGLSTAPPFSSLIVTASSASQVTRPVASSAAWESSPEDPSAFHYFEPLGAKRHDGVGLDSQSLANVAVRETFVAFWLMTKKDLDDLQRQRDAIDAAAASIHTASSGRVPDQRRVEESLTADTEQADIVHKALAAISGADDVLRQADEACAVAAARTAEPASIAETAIAQALASSATKTNQPTSSRVDASQPSSPRWQLGMCSLVSILFSFRAPGNSSGKASRSDDERQRLLKARRANAQAG